MFATPNAVMASPTKAQAGSLDFIPDNIIVVPIRAQAHPAIRVITSMN